MHLSLQGRFLIFLLLPVALMNLGTAMYGFLYARESLIEQWIGAANAKLKSAAGEIHSGLREKLILIDAIAAADDIPHSRVMQAFLVQRLVAMPDVRSVNVDSVASEWFDIRASRRVGATRLAEEAYPDRSLLADSSLFFHAAYGYLDIIRQYQFPGKSAYKQIAVRVDATSVLASIPKQILWTGADALLVTADGQCLAHTDPRWIGQTLGQAGHPLEKKVLARMGETDSATIFGQGRPPDLIMGYHRIPSTNWYLVVYSRGCEICEPMLRFRFYFTVGNIAALAVILFLIVFVTRSVTSSIRQLSASAERVEQADYSVQLTIHRHDEIGQLQRSFNRMIEGLRRRDLIETTFGRYVGRQIAAELMSSPDALNLGGEEKTVSILMADLREFTVMAEKHEPREVISVLNRYLSAMIGVIEQHGGIIVDFYGDGILAFFNGMERDVAGKAVDAVTCAIHMQRRLRALSAANEAEGLPRLSMGVGIHTGKVVVGNVGSDTRAKYGIVGSAVNLTQRVESIAQGGSIIITADTHNILGEAFNFSRKIEVCFKGVEDVKDLYEVAYETDNCESVHGPDEA